jgi:hypothetical protein
VRIVGNHDSGSRRLCQVVRTRYGGLRLAAIEDLVVKRLIEARHRKRPEAMAEALLAVSRFDSDLDWEYLNAQASMDGVIDLALALRRRVRIVPPRSDPDRPPGAR